MSVTLISSDGPQFDLTVEAAKLSVMISNTLDLKGHDEDDDDDEDDSLPANMEPLQLNNIPGETLEKIVEYLKHYVDDPMPEIPQPLPYETFAENMPHAWYSNFITSLDNRILYQLMSASHYLDIAPLVALAILRITYVFQGMTPEQIQATLNFPQLTPEEEERARREHPWIWEDSGRTET